MWKISSYILVWVYKQKNMKLFSSRIHSPWLGGKVNSGIGLSYRPAILHDMAGQYDNAMPESTLSPIRDYEFG